MYGNNYYTQPRYQVPNMNTNMQQPMVPQYIPPMQQTMPIQTGLLGKVVDNIDVVRATDIPLDGSTSYFPISDGSCIVTKQLQNDGTSKLVVYKPATDEKEEVVKYATIDDIQDAINNIDISDIQDIQDLKDDIKEIKKQLRDFKNKKGKDDE